MFASDKTQLSQFGDNTLWPLYLVYGNESKYMRNKPQENLAEIVAFFDKASMYYLRLSHRTNSGLFTA